MQNVYIVDCKECGDIASAIFRLDEKIAKIVNNMYLSLTVYAEKRYSRQELKTLIRYRNILQHLYYNGDYYTGFDYRQIISKVKSIT